MSDALGIAALNNIAGNLGKLISQTALGIVVPITQGGTGAISATAARGNLGIGNVGSVQIGALVGANLDSTLDQAIGIVPPAGTSSYALDAVAVTNPSGSLSAAEGGIYTAPAGAGVAVVPSTQVYSALTTNAPNTVGSILFLTIEANVLLSVTTLYLHLSVAQGAAVTADFRVYGRPLY